MYGYHLVRALSEIDRENTYFLYVNKPVSLDFPLPPNFFIRPAQLPLPQFQFWFHIGLPITFRRDKLDIFHGTNFLIPPMPGCKTVSTIHDLSSIVMPAQHRFFHRLSHSLFLRASMKRADMLIGDSVATQNEILRIFQQYREKTAAVLIAAGPEFSEIDDKALLDSIREKYSLPERFFLYVGTLEPRKNISGLLAAFNKVKDKLDQKLVVVGGRGWKYSDIFNNVTENGLDEHIVFTGYIAKEDLPGLYNLAEFFCYPSFYEGFGLPVMEAMSCGTPVITSNRSSMAEIAGDAAILVNPESSDDIAKALLRMSTDEPLRTELKRAGIEHSKEFSWRKTAEQTLNIYRRLVHQ